MAIDISGMAEYQAVIDKINLWYGSDAQQIIDVVNQYELTPRQVADGYLSGSGFEPWYTTSGAIGGYMSSGTASINPATAAQEAANSNVGSTSQVMLKTPVETTVNQSGKVEASAGLTNVATGTKSPLTFITKEVLPAVSAAGLGITLGKTIDYALYNANPDFWDNHGMASLNPQTWNSITQDYPDGVLKKAFNTIFGLKPDTGETQMYLDKDAVAYLAQYMQEKGVFNTADLVRVTDLPSESYPYANQISARMPLTVSATGVYGIAADGSHITLDLTPGYTYLLFNDPNSSRIEYLWGRTDRTSATPFEFTYDGKTVHYGIGYGYLSNIPVSFSNGSNNGATLSDPPLGQMIWLALYNSVSSGGGVDGIPTQASATTPDFSGCTTPQDYLNRLQSTYPDMFNNAVSQTIANPDGTTSTKTFLPIGTPSSGNTTQPVTTGENSGNQQNGQSANPNTVDLTGLKNLINQLTKTISKTGTPTDTTNPDPTGTGTTPPVVVPTGSASALWTVYNPTQAQLNSFGAWLWSSNFIDQVLKLFNNPMQSIIGVHKIFASPSISGSGNITVGYLDSGVSANVVGAQYTTINCGSVKVREQFGNVFDYEDTQVRLYLPFIGIVQLDTADVMRGSVSVVYHVDVITGACLAEVKVTRDGGGGTLYQFSGDAAVRYPISSGSYMGVVSGVLGVVGGIASGIMSGGATLPMAAGAIAGGLSGAKTQVQHSGSFAGNAGAMGGKKPYLIIERPQSAVADGCGAYQGKGANNIATVGAMSGYFKMTDIHAANLNGASEAEIASIVQALESGVIA